MRLVGLKQRDGKGVIAILPVKLVPPSGVPTAESTQEILQSGILSNIKPTSRRRTRLFSDGARGWPAALKKSRLASRIDHYHVRHNKHEYCKRVKTQKKSKPILAGTQCIDRFWQSLDKFIPAQIASKEGKGKGANERLLDYIFAFVWRSQLSPLADMRDAIGNIC